MTILLIALLVFIITQLGRLKEYVKVIIEIWKDKN